MNKTMVEEEESLLYGRFLASPPPGEEVVISGMAGNFPESDNLYELRDNFFNHVNMVTDDERRWKRGDPRIPHPLGKIKDLSKFDAAFFGFHSKQAHCTCPMLRCLLERTYEAIVDAGINPASLRGTRTGVYLGSCFSETEKCWIYDRLEDHGYPLTSCLRSSFSKRISHWLGVNGPSMVTDSACSSSLFSLNQAYEDLRSGLIDFAIIGSSSICVNPLSSLQFAALGVLSPDGRVKAFDQRADGYARSETAAVAFLQRAKNAKRIYAKVIHSKTNCDGFKPEGIAFPAREVHEQLFRDFYRECQINPATISYLEAHGTGTKVGDPVELYAVEQVFCPNRDSPLPIGSGKSNLGHSEAASGSCSLGKVVITVETGVIPANLNYEIPKSVITGLTNGKLKVISENTPLSGDLVAINSFGFGGANAHLLLQRNQKVKINGGAPADCIPRLIVASGRTEEAVESILRDVLSRPVDAEFTSLLHDVFAVSCPGHLYRGYALLAPGDGRKQHLQYYDQVQRPLWLMISRCGDGWLELGRSLLQVPRFAATIELCSQAGIDVKKILSMGTSDPIGNSVALAAVQLGLVDVLSCIGISPAGMLGHSTGELVCAYVDGCLTAQQVVAAVYNHAVSKKEDLLLHLQQIILNPKQRSRHWVSLSVPESESCDARTRLASPQYFHYCLDSPGLLEDAIHLVPKNALVVDLASPDIIQRLLGKPHCTNMSTFTPSSFCGVESLLIMLGRLYEAGVPMQLSRLYPSVQYPVSRGTPMIAPLIRWEHSQSWTVGGMFEANTQAAERTVSVSVADPDCEFYTGHVIDGRNLFPATGYLLLAWETFSQMLGAHSLSSVVFEDVRFQRATTLPAEGKVEFIVSIQKHSGEFEVAESGSAIVTGRIKRLEDADRMLLDLPLPKPGREDDCIDLDAKDIYKELRLRGYNYSGVFRGLVSANTRATRGIIRWSDNWIGFLDTMLQMRILSKDARLLYVPTAIDKMVIDVEKHAKELEDLLPIYSWDHVDVVRAGGVEIQRLSASSITRRRPLGEPVLERYQFVPHTTELEPILSEEQAIRMFTHIVLENHLGIKVRVYELSPPDSRPDVQFLAPHLAAILGDLPLIQAEVLVLAKEEDSRAHDLGSGIQCLNVHKLPPNNSALLVVGTDIVQDGRALNNALEMLDEDGCILAREMRSVDVQAIGHALQIIADHAVGNERFLLLKQKKQMELPPPVVIHIAGRVTSWLPALQAALRNAKLPERVVLVSQGEPLSGILGLFNCIRKEPGGQLARCFFILDPRAPKFNPSLPLYSRQLEKDLAVNVLQDGRWGSYRHLLLELPSKVTAEHAYNNVLLRGDLSSLTWIEGPLCNVRNLVHIYYSALNFRDIMMSTGKLAVDVLTSDRTKMDIQQGFEFSGRDSSGNRIMGITTGALANIADSIPELVWNVPVTWSLEDAATVPIVYATVIYALKVKGHLEGGETVLIHAGSGGVGQAAINYCLFHGCTVFTTVGTQEKRDFIKKHFPQITDEHIGNSRDSTFEEFIMQRTKGRGVDLVLNSLAEEKLRASVRCLAEGGRFLEIGKFDLSNNNPLAMDMFARHQSFHSIMLDLFFYCEREEQAYLRGILEAAIREGSVKPLVRKVFGTDSVEQAFRFMAAGKHIGKVLIKIRPEEDDLYVEPKGLPMEVKPRFYCDSRLTYIVIGGLGGFGLELTDWLVLRGARKLILTSRKGISTGYQSLRVQIWHSYGATVTISTADVSTEEGADTLLRYAATIAPVGGIFNLAVVLRDALLENQTEDSFEESFKGKALATHHLDVLSRRMCPQLKEFVVFSSVSCGRGNAGQTNYGMSNSVMERLCEARARDGLPALAVQWGAVGEVGLVAEMQQEQHELVIGGTLQQRISSCLETMDTFLRQPHPVVASMVVAEKRSATGKFDNIVDCVCNILGLSDLKTVSGMSTLSELGMDSMMAVEIKQVMEREFEVFLTPQEIRNLTLKQLQGLSSSEPSTATQGLKQAEFVFNFYGNWETGSQVVLPLTAGSTAATVFMVPGMEGTAITLAELGGRLAEPAVGLQLCCHNTSTTIPGMASHLLQHIREQLDPGKPFTFVGHSFGGLVALEMAATLEAEGFLGHIVLLDASPELTFQLVEQHLLQGAPDESTMQILLLYRMLAFVAPASKYSIQEFTAALRQLNSWDERTEWLLDLTPPADRDYQRSIVNVIYVHIKAILNYTWEEGRRLRSSVTLVRPNNSLVKMEGDCGLSKICLGGVAVHFVDGDHTGMLREPKTAEIINRVLQGCPKS